MPPLALRANEGSARRPSDLKLLRLRHGFQPVPHRVRADPPKIEALQAVTEWGAAGGFAIFCGSVVAKTKTTPRWRLLENLQERVSTPSAA